MTISTLEDISIIFTRIAKSKSKRLKHTYYHEVSAYGSIFVLREVNQEKILYYHFTFCVYGKQ